MRPQPCFLATRPGRRAFHVSSLRALLAVALLSFTAARATHAAWQPDGVPLSPPPGQGETYSLRGLAADGSNGAFAVWEFRWMLPDFSAEQVAWRAQRVDANGNRPAPWPADGALLRSWFTDASFGTHAMDPVGLYEDGGGGAVLAALDHTFIVEPMTLFRLFHIGPGGAVGPIDIAGSFLGGYAVRAAAADADGAGGVILIGLGQTFAPPLEPRPPSPLFAQRVDASGQTLWNPSEGVALNTAGETGISGVAALSDGAGGGFFAWIDLREPGDPDVYVQHLDASGALAAGWPAGGVPVCGAAGSQDGPHLAPDGSGGVIVAWTDSRSGVPRLLVHAVRADGTPDPAIPADGRQIPSADMEDTFFDLAADGQGGCFVTRAGAIPSLTAVTRLHRLDATLLARPGWPETGLALNTFPPFFRFFSLAADGLGGAFVVFMDASDGNPPDGLDAQHFGPDGAPAPGWTADGYRLSVDGRRSAIVRSGSGAIVAWDDVRTPHHGVYAQRLVPDGPVAAQLALVSAAATGGRVALRWYSADGLRLRATLERRTDGSAWAPLAELTADGTGALAYEDAAVTPGVRYGYRLVWRDGDITREGGEAWVTVARAEALALEAPSPNPARGAVTLAVTLPAARGARLDVFDLSGRRVAGRALDALGAGRHVVTLDEAASLAPGMYVVRLTQAGAARRTRLVRVE